MRVKRYVADSMPEALQRIRTELGNDAVILNSKEVRSGGLFGMFSKKRIEVIAATDPGHEPASGTPIRPDPGKAAAQLAGMIRDANRAGKSEPKLQSKPQRVVQQASQPL